MCAAVLRRGRNIHLHHWTTSMRIGECLFGWKRAESPSLLGKLATHTLRRMQDEHNAERSRRKYCPCVYKM